MTIRPPLLFLASVLCAPGWAAEGRYAALFLGSAHIGTANLNDVNPGLGLGWRRQADWCRCENAVEFGAFYNSYEEIAPYLASTWVREVARPRPEAQLMLGLLAGIARYQELAPRLRREHGIPAVAGFIPVVGLVASWRWRDRHELRLKLVPPGADVDLILGISLTRSF